MKSTQIEQPIWPAGFKYVCEACIDAGHVVGTNNLYKRRMPTKWPVGSCFYLYAPLCTRHGKPKNLLERKTTEHC